MLKSQYPGSVVPLAMFLEFPQIRSGHPRRVCAYPPSKTAVAPIHFVQLVIYFVQLDTNCHPLSWCIQKHHSQRTFTYCCENGKGIFCIFLLLQNSLFRIMPSLSFCSTESVPETYSVYRLRLWWYYWHSIPSYRAYSTMVQDPSEMAFFRTSKISSHSLPPILLNLVLCKSLQDHIRPTANFVHQTQQIMCEWEGDNFYNHTVKLWDLNPWAYWLQPWDIALKPSATTDSEFYHICSRIGQDKTRQDKEKE